MYTLKLILKEAGYPMNLTIHWRQGEVIAGTGDPPAQSEERENINTCRETMLQTILISE